MGHIRIAAATGTGPIPKAAFDSALTDIGIERYNLLTLSSVIPAGATVTVEEQLPNLGPTGYLLPAVIAKAIIEPGAAGATGLAWSRRPSGEGIFYEATGEDAQSVEDALHQGIAHGCSLRDWGAGEPSTLIERASAPADGYACALVIAAYGQARQPFE